MLPSGSVAISALEFLWILCDFFYPPFMSTIGFYRLLPATFTNGDVANYDSQAVIRQIVDRVVV